MAILSKGHLLLYSVDVVSFFFVFNEHAKHLARNDQSSLRILEIIYTYLDLSSRYQ